MSCIVIYKDNKPVGVQDSEGNSSKLFQDILSNPHVGDFNAALEIYQNIYSGKLKVGAEPIAAKEQKFYLEVNKELETLINPVLTELNSLGKEPIIVGGAVRDAFLGKNPKDFDIEVYNTSLEDLENTLKKYGKVDAVGKDFGILKFTPYIPGTTNLVKLEEPFDFSIPRREAKMGVGHKGFKTEFDLGMTKSEAASRRDFTWNTLGYNPITHTLYDYYGGITDLKAGVIRHTTDKFREDPLRIMRAMQFQARLGYEVAPETYALMREMVESGEFDSLPTERITEEWTKWASKGVDHTGIFDFLRNSGLGERYYPELMALKDTVQDATWHPEGDVEAHTKQVLAKANEIAERENLSDKDKQILIFSSLLHDISKPETTETIYSAKLGRDTITARGHEAAGEAKAINILSKIGIPVALREQVGSLIREHLAHATISSIESEKGKQSAFAKLVNRTQPASVEQLMLLMEADMLGRDNANAPTPITIQEFDRLLTEYKDNNKGKLTFTPILSGKHLIERGFKPGIELGAVLAKAKEAQLNLDFTNESEALEWLSSYLTENPTATQADIKRQVVAYHGSPYSFNNFSTNYINTGEGAQAFGWGLYFTDIKGIAEEYAIKLSKVSAIDSVLNKLGITETSWRVREEIYNYADKYAKADWLWESINDGYYEDFREEEINQLKKFAEYKAIKGDDLGISRNLYEVSLHKGKQPSDYDWMIWDKPVQSKQLNKLKARLSEKVAFFTKKEEESSNPFNQISKDQAQEKLNYINNFEGGTVEQFYKGLAKEISQEEASKTLLDAGIDGIKYPAESISSGANSDTAKGFNYVVFDENTITVEKQVQFKKEAVSSSNEEVVTPILDRLLETDLADNVYYVSGEEIQTALEKLGVEEGKSVEGVSLITAGFIHGKNVYINKDQATSETAIHEFNHLYTNWLKSNRPEVYNKGIELVKENADGALDEIIQSVRDTQPDLKEGSEAFYEEVLTEAVGKEGAKIIAEKPDSPIAEWLQEVWDTIKNMLGLSNYSTEEVLNMNLEDYVNASAVDLLSGKVLPVVNNTTNSRPIEPFTERYPLSFVKPSDIIDFKALLADIQAKGEKVWFWMGDQLGRGEYIDSVTGQTHFMDAGLSYALDPVNRDRGAIWASGLAGKTLAGKTKEADYIFIISGSPSKSKLFNNNVQKVFVDRIGDFSKFKRDVLTVSKNKAINEFLAGKESFEDFKKAEMKNFIISLREQEKLKKTPLKAVLDSYGVFLDINGLRDGFLVANDFKANDVMLVLKPTHVGGESTHSTYNTELMGEVVGVPDIIVSSYDIIDEKAKEKYVNGLSESAKTKVVAAEIGKTHKLASEIKFQKKEPTLVYKNTKGEVFNSAQEAIKNSVENNISMGVDTIDGFKELAVVNTTTNINTKEGIVNSLVKSNLLSGETFIDTNGKKVYKVKGNEKAKKIINSELAIASIRERLGVKSAKTLSNGDIVFDDNHTKRQIAITKKDGSTEYITPEDLSNMTFSQLRKENEDAVAIIALRDFKSNTSIYGEKVEEEVPFMPENELQLKLMTLLKSMGVKTTSIADYVANYTVKNGIEPSAQALADLANNVIAFKDGVVQAEDLLEETAHFIIAQTSEAEKADLKRNIHKSPEWAEFQASYREIYSNTYSGEELEDIVREEILGKVLKNAVANRFKAETEGQQNIYNKVLEFFKNFFTKVEAYFTNDSQSQLNKFTSAVYENLMNDSLSGMLTGENNRNYTLYSTSNNSNGAISQEYKQASELLERLTQQQYELSKKYNSAGNTNQLQAAKAQMENLDNQVDEVARMKALLNLARVANSQINTLTNVVETNLKKGYHFSQEENSVYQSFVTKLEPLLAQVNSQITGSTTQEKQVKNEIESVLRKSITLKGKTPLINEKALEVMVDRVIKKNSLTGAEADRYREEIKSIMSVAQKDTQFLHAHLGSLSNAKNGFLNLAGDVIERVQYTERSLYLPRIKSFLTNMNKIGFDTKNLKKFIKNGYIINEVDAVKEKTADAEDRVDSFNAAGLGVATVEDIDAKLQEVDVEIRNLETSKADKVRLTDLIKARQDYFRKYKMKKSKRRETYFTPEYLAKMESAFVLIDGDKISKRDLPESAREMDKFYRSQITQIRLNAENGILTAAESEEIRELNRQRQQSTFPRDTEGNLKKGLTETYNSDLGKYIVGRDMTVQVSDSEASERDIVYGLQMMGLINQEFYKSQPSLNGIPTKFLEELNKLGSEKEKWDFIQLNSYIGFEDSFWESFKPEDSLVNRLRAAGETDIVEEIRTQQQIITNILKQNRKFNSPTETDMSVSTGMSQIEIDSIKNASSILENILSRARGLLKDETEPNLEIESKTNEAYRESLEDLGINTLEEEIKFISSNATPSNAGYIESARKIAEGLKRGEDVKLNKTFSRVFSKGMNADEVEAALLTYAKSKLLPYFKRTEPVGYSERLASFRESVDNNVSGTVENLLLGTSSLSSDIKVSPSFSFFESTEGVNPKWLANRDSKRDQYSKEWLDRVRDDEYYTTFGVNKDTGVRTGNLNQKDWEAREELLSLQDWTLENYKLAGTHNRYLLPQQRKNAIERGIKGLKNDVTDFVSYREDERELGQEIGGVAAKKGSTLLTIPTYGVQKIEDQEDVSTQLLESYAWMAQQSSLYRARKENISDMLVLNDLILHNTTYGAKEAEATATYTMFKSFLQANFYGVKESLSYETTVAGKRIDLGKIAKSFNNWVRFSNLAGVTVPITSAITGKIAEFVEKAVGEAINPMAYKKAHTEFVKNSSEAAREIGGFTSNAKLNVVLEAIGVYNVNERFQNSNYGKSTRVGLKASSGLHAMGNFPVTATTGLSVIYDYKYYGDDIITFDQFKRKNPTKDATTIKDEWSKLDEFYSDWVVKDGVLTFDKASIAKKINVANLDELLNLKMEAISTRTTSVIQRVDAQVPEHQRSLASRNAFANFFMMHLNWFLIQSQLKLKDRHYNISEDTYQEGNWRTAWNFLQSGIMKPKNIKQLWKDSMADELTRKNLKRTMVELSVANALAVAAMLLANYVDDEEDPSWFLAWSDYMMTRAAVEQISGTVALPKQVGELLTNPLIASQKFYDLFNILDVFSSEETKTGVYAGESARMKWARRNLPWIRDYTRLKDPKSAADTYTYFAVEQPNLYNDWAWLSNAFDSDSEE